MIRCLGPQDCTFVPSVDLPQIEEMAYLGLIILCAPFTFIVGPLLLMGSWAEWALG